MNRIVIIGNGFDLASGVKSSYEDFLLHFLKSEIKSKIENPNEEKNRLFEVTAHNVDLNYYYESVEKISSIADFKNVVSIDSGMTYDAIFHPLEKPTIVNQHKIKLEINCKSKFFSELIDNNNWTDIEKFYFETLYNFFEAKFNERSNLLEEVKKLNQDFDFLKMELVIYLQEQNRIKEYTSKYYILQKCLEQPSEKYIEKFLSSDFKKDNEKISLNQTIFLNFNYTDSIVPFVNHNYDKSREIQIHGNINNLNTIIFGYGDDFSNSKYKTLEDYDMKELLEHIKSIHYPKQKFYIDLMNFIEADIYDVIVLGHSLGLSDRVLLESLFETDNCKSIRLFHRGNEKSYTDKIISLSRHFRNKQSMRRKVEYNSEDVLN